MQSRPERGDGGTRCAVVGGGVIRDELEVTREVRRVQTSHSRRSDSDRTSLYDEVTNKIIADLEAGLGAVGAGNDGGDGAAWDAEERRPWVKALLIKATGVDFRIGGSAVWPHTNGLRRPMGEADGVNALYEKADRTLIGASCKPTASRARCRLML